jgi:hypothetical protein
MKRREFLRTAAAAAALTVGAAGAARATEIRGTLPSPREEPGPVAPPKGAVMEPAKETIVQAVRLTEGPAPQFYGYYDLPAFSADEKLHLVHRVPFFDRLPQAEDVAELGLIRLADRSYTKLAETRAWNFQQGSMLQWHPAAPGREVIFNVREGDAYRGAVLDVTTGARRLLDRPVANVDPQGRCALSINFGRMFLFRPGYGYEGIPDPCVDQPRPEEDGVFLTDLATGQSRLVLSLARIAEAFPADSPLRTQKILINHITFNPDASRFVFLVRNFPDAKGKWLTLVFTANRDGSEVFLLNAHGYASHYHWRDAEHVVFHCGGPQKNQLYVLKDRTQECEVVDAAFFKADGHCSYSPDRQWLMYDGYPFADGYRRLFLYDLEKRKGVTLGAYYSLPKITGDIRCDLHPRWNRSGTGISFDSVHEGQRGVYLVDLRETMQKMG